MEFNERDIEGVEVDVLTAAEEVEFDEEEAEYEDEIEVNTSKFAKFVSKFIFAAIAAVLIYYSSKFVFGTLMVQNQNEDLVTGIELLQ